jgi:hypothetical protein
MRPTTPCKPTSSRCTASRSLGSEATKAAQSVEHDATGAAFALGRPRAFVAAASLAPALGRSMEMSPRLRGASVAGERLQECLDAFGVRRQLWDREWIPEADLRAVCPDPRELARARPNLPHGGPCPPSPDDEARSELPAGAERHCAVTLLPARGGRRWGRRGARALRDPRCRSRANRGRSALLAGQSRRRRSAISTLRG